jgi:hypothetical protein
MHVIRRLLSPWPIHLPREAELPRGSRGPPRESPSARKRVISASGPLPPQSVPVPRFHPSCASRKPQRGAILRLLPSRMRMRSRKNRGGSILIWSISGSLWNLNREPEHSGRSISFRSSVSRAIRKSPFAPYESHNAVPFCGYSSPGLVMQTGSSQSHRTSPSEHDDRERIGGVQWSFGQFPCHLGLKEEHPLGPPDHDPVAQRYFLFLRPTAPNPARGERAQSRVPFCASESHNVVLFRGYSSSQPVMQTA